MIFPRVNILVLNWNGDQVLNDCVESILQTDYENYNLTIIDNGSTDSSLETIDNFISDKINIISINKNLGFSKAYNYAFSKLADKNLTKEEKEQFIEKIALENVDIDARALYTLGEIRKTSEKQDIKNFQIAFEKYFLKSLISRLSEYSDWTVWRPWYKNGF